MGLPYYFCSFSKCIYIYIGCLNIHRTLLTANNFTNNNVVFFFSFRFEIVYYKKQLILDHNALDTRGKNILRHYLFRDKGIQNCLKIDATHLYDNGLLSRQETQKRIACPGS